jgi:predicted dienelactone hydrolase
MNRIIATLGVATLAACGSPNPGGHPGTNLDAPPGATSDAVATSDAPTATTTDPADDGPATVTSTIVQIPATTGHTVPATIYTSPGATALVVISPGFQMARTQYATYAHHLATWGFVVVLTDYADQGFFADHQLMANDVTEVITYALTAQPGIDPAKIAVAGHSLGGDISVLAAAGDPRVKAVVGWDPVDASSPSVVPEHMTGFTAALAVIGETTDATGGFMPCAPSADNYEQFYAAAPSPAFAMTIDGADHMDWVDDGTCAFCTACTAGTAAPDRAHTATRRLNVAWLRAQLLGDTAMQPWLASPPEVNAGIATIERK